jgi:hypothetical protein
MSEENVKRVFVIKYVDGSYDLEDNTTESGPDCFDLKCARKWTSYDDAVQYFAEECQGWGASIKSVKVTKKAKPK